MFPHAPPPPRSLAALRTRYGERYRWWALVAVSLGAIAAVLSATIFNVAAPALMRDFGLGQDGVQWAVSAYMATMTLAMLPVAWLIERHGFRRVFLAAIVLLAVGSIGGAVAPDFPVVIAMRVLQGAAAGLMQPLTTLLVMRHFPLGAQGRAMGLVSFGIILAPAVAPVLGGVLVDVWGWRAIFLITLPGCLAAWYAGRALLPVRDAAAPRAGAFDWRGLSWLSLAILSLLQSVGSLHSHGLLAPLPAGCALLAVAGFAAFYFHATRRQAPLLRPDLFRVRTLAIGTIVSFIYGAGLFGSTYLIPVFLQTVLGYSATSAGFVLMPGGLALALAMPFAGRLADRMPAYLQCIAGLLLFALSFGAMAWLATHPDFLALIVTVVLGRIGLALILPALNLGALRELAPADIAQGSGLVNCVRQIGGTLGVSGGAVFLEWRSTALGPGSDEQAFTEVFVLVACAFVLAMLTATRMRPHAAD